MVLRLLDGFTLGAENFCVFRLSEYLRLIHPDSLQRQPIVFGFDPDGSEFRVHSGEILDAVFVEHGSLHGARRRIVAVTPIMDSLARFTLCSVIERRGGKDRQIVDPCGAGLLTEPMVLISEYSEALSVIRFS